jgi:predicted O-methyltransferase YrrM
MQKLIVRALQEAQRYGYGLILNKGELQRLSANPDVVAQAIARAFTESSRWHMSSDERTQIEKIERLRTDLNASTEILETVTHQNTPITLTVGDVSRRASTHPKWALMMFRLIRETKPEKCLELGTCLGVSSAYQAAALQLNGHGSLVTLEKSEVRVSKALQHVDKLGLANVKALPGLFSDTLPSVLSTHTPVEFAFIDGHHDGHATIEYFRQIAPHTVAGRSILIFDDIDWSTDMKQAWQTIKNDERMYLTVDLFKWGIGVIGDNHAPKQSYKLAFN